MFALCFAEVPRSTLVPSGWTTDAGFARFRYSHPLLRGKTFLVVVRENLIAAVIVRV